ncbi:hypothetical protein AB9K26_04015 [Psychroserpens sp. XS_ASV72]|uniref:hypothetical protein n=1 Tax=Psychroserpens sp. XS_ASV72 TaxID=3241293 RepID=UPI0035160D3E
MNTISIYKVDAYRRLCISKDLKELELWMHTLESFNHELDHFTCLEKQLIKNGSISNEIKAIRRKNILTMASLCKYEQELKTEYEYGKTEYNEVRLKYHLQKRENYLKLKEEYSTFKNKVFNILKRFRAM